MLTDGIRQIARSAVMQQKQAFTNSPQGSSAEFLASRISLADAVGESGTHLVQGKIRVEIDGLLAERFRRHDVCLQLWCVTHGAACRIK